MILIEAKADGVQNDEQLKSKIDRLALVWNYCKDRFDGAGDPILPMEGTGALSAEILKIVSS